MIPGDGRSHHRMHCRTCPAHTRGAYTWTRRPVVRTTFVHASLPFARITPVHAVGARLPSVDVEAHFVCDTAVSTASICNMYFQASAIGVACTLGINGETSAAIALSSLTAWLSLVALISPLAACVSHRCSPSPVSHSVLPCVFSLTVAAVLIAFISVHRRACIRLSRRSVYSWSVRTWLRRA